MIKLWLICDYVTIKLQLNMQLCYDQVTTIMQLCYN